MDGEHEPEVEDSNSIIESTNITSGDFQDDPWPNPEISPPTTEVKCGCEEHPEKPEFNIYLPISAHTLYRLITNDEFLIDYHKARKDRELVIGPWNSTEPCSLNNGQSQVPNYNAIRDLKYIVDVNVPMSKVKETNCNETMKILKYEPGLSYVIEFSASTPKYS